MHKNSTVPLNRPASHRMRVGEWAEETAPCVKWYPGVTSRSANGLPRRLSPPPLPPEMSVSRLLRTRVCAAADADADATAADAEAARLEDPGHGCPASGT